MGLLSTEVEVTLHGKNITYYENLGYDVKKEINKYGQYTTPKNTKIMVKVSDLPPQSAIHVDLSCDLCNKKISRRYCDYVKRNAKDDKTYCRNCVPILNSGENNYYWNPNLTEEDRVNNRDYKEYFEFVQKVLYRDNYTCQCCGHKSTGLVVHHLNGYHWYKEGRTDVTNGITLCDKCHKTYHKVYGCKNNTKEQFEEWIGESIKLIEQNIKLPEKKKIKKKIICLEDKTIYNNPYELQEKLGYKTINSILSVCNHIITKNGNYEYKRTKLKGKHYLWLNEYNSMSKSDIDNYLEESKYKRNKPVICITTSETFDSIIEARNIYNICERTMYRHLNEGGKSAGKLSDGTKLKWMYYDDFLKLSQEEQNEILSRNQESSNDGSFIM